jgi:hypothetical protein
MRKLYVCVCLLLCAPVRAQVYQCPETSPSDKEGPTLVSAEMHVGERHAQAALHGDIAEVKDGTDTHYNFPDATPRWMVCQYGGKRISATLISPARVVGGREWWMQLDPLVDVCDLKIREIKGRGRGNAMWTAIAICKGKEPPPPVMLE